MRLGALRVELFISDGNSLKHKRSVLRPIKDRIRNHFNVSVSEVDEQDKWQKAILGVAAVGPDKDAINAVLDKILDFIRRDGKVQILDYEMEII